MFNCNSYNIKSWLKRNKKAFEENDTCVYVEDGSGFSLVFYHQNPMHMKQYAGECHITFIDEELADTDSVDEIMHQELQATLFALIKDGLVTY